MNECTAPADLHVVGAAILHEGRCLIAQRSPTMALAGKWEFPGGKIEGSESPQAALAREIEEELGIRIRVGDFLGRGSSQSGDKMIILDVFAAELLRGKPSPHEHANLAWARADELPGFDWAEADIPIVAAVQQALARQARN